MVAIEDPWGQPYERDDWPESYEPGSFCMHWNDPGDCDEICPHCGHPCQRHSAFYGCELCECTRG